MLDSLLGAESVGSGSSGNEGATSFESEMPGSSGMEGIPSGSDSILGAGSLTTGKTGEGEMSTEGKATGGDSLTLSCEDVFLLDRFLSDHYSHLTKH